MVIYLTKVPFFFLPDSIVLCCVKAPFFPWLDLSVFRLLSNAVNLEMCVSLRYLLHFLKYIPFSFMVTSPLCSIMAFRAEFLPVACKHSVCCAASLALSLVLGHRLPHRRSGFCLCLICFSLLTSDIEDLFTNLLVNCVSSLEKCLFSGFVLSLKAGLFVLLLLHYSCFLDSNS